MDSGHINQDMVNMNYFLVKFLGSICDLSLAKYFKNLSVKLRSPRESRETLAVSLLCSLHDLQ